MYEFQVELVNRLNKVFQLVFSSKNFFSRFKKNNITSTYIFGLPGGGKTYIANIFLKFIKENKLNQYILRLHFQEFMSMMHKQINSLRKTNTKNPLDKIAIQISKKYKLICFDELEIIDIADAMIVSKLFKALLEKNICFIITSNFIPRDLYKHGLQRDQFIPFIDIIENKMSLINIENNLDLRLKSKKNFKNFYYCYPLDKSSQNTFHNFLNSLKSKNEFKITKIKSLGRDLVFEKTLDRIVISDFKFLCSYRFSPNDYISISKAFEWFFIDKIPILNKSMFNEARRFITLIDIMYEKKNRLVIRAEQKIEKIFLLEKNKELPFLRTASRIKEMTSKEWQN